LVKRVAEAGNGSCLIVENNNNIRSKVIESLKKVNEPALSNVRI
jgi:hypothetical protein